MIKGREILGLPVVTMDEREQIGEVKDIIYDPYQNIILGCLLEAGGWIRSGKGFLYNEVLKLDRDGLIIKDRLVARNINTITEFQEVLAQKIDIRGLRLEKEDGQYMGVIQDLVIDEKTGEITGYEVSDGVIQDLLDGRATVSNMGACITEDRVIAPEGTQFDFISKGELV